MSDTNKLIQTPLSNIDLNNLLKDVNIELGGNESVNIFTVDEMKKHTQEFKNKLNKYEYCIIFINPRNKAVGHWTILFKTKNQLYFFDSYGNEPNTLDPQLHKFLMTHYPDTIYNTFQYQRYSDNVATCGRWAMFVLGLKRIFKNLNVEMIHKILTNLKKKYKKSYDFIIAHLINFDI